MDKAHTPNAHHDELVIVLHGLGNPPFILNRLIKAYREAGYPVEVWKYKSFHGGLAQHIAGLQPRFNALHRFRRIHGVGHSLGGLILRGLFAQAANPQQLGHLLLIGTPNHGAGLVQRLGLLTHIWPLNRPIIHDLAAHSAAITALPVPTVPLGVIAGTRSFHPINPLCWLNALALGTIPSDGTVEVESTKLDTMQDYLEVAANHLFLPMHPQTIKAALNFIATGMFDRAQNP